jgi:hypothetical protein
MAVVQSLSEKGMDLIEISGGTYESPEMTGVTRKESTQKREAYFLDYCEKVRKLIEAPLMLTGGFRSRKGMDSALASGACDIIGVARSMAIDPDFPRKLLNDENIKSQVVPLTTGIRFLDKLVPLEITWYTQQIHRLANGQSPNPSMSAFGSAIKTIAAIGAQGLKRVRENTP